VRPVLAWAAGLAAVARAGAHAAHHHTHALTRYDRPGIAYRRSPARLDY